MCRTFLLFLLLFTSSILKAQESKETPYDLKRPQPQEQEKVCGEFIKRIKTLPGDVSMGFLEKDGEVYWGITDETWISKIFGNRDAIAADIVLKSQFPCGQKNLISQSDMPKGELQRPIELREAKRSMIVDETGLATFPIAEIPAHLKGQDYEVNMLLIHDGYMCQYTSFYNIPIQEWQLPEMPMFYDSSKANGATVVLEKKLQFVIPFQKNKFTYSEKDIKPLYDSLRLTDYTIKSIRIRAYASVEGSAENNIKLQNNRAEAIAKALEAVQKQEAIKNIIAEENWVEFLEDVEKTEHKSLTSLQRTEIKAKLETGGLAAALEPVLSKHRKAVVELDLEKKSSYLDASPDLLKDAFLDAIEKKDSLKSLEIQEVIITRIRKKQISTELLDSTVIPVEKKFAHLHNNRVAFHAEHSTDINKSLNEFLELKKLFPWKGAIDYNIAVLKLKRWAANDTLTTEPELKREITALAKRGIKNVMVKKLLVNYHIILSEVLMEMRDYPGKNMAMKFVFDNHKTLGMKDADLLQLSRYFSAYSRDDWAEKMLNVRVRNLNAEEELVFYYINLTIANPKNVKKASYRSIINNAAGKNPKRFCKMFDAYGKGGINFQLLADDYLKKTYCDVCK